MCPKFTASVDPAPAANTPTANPGGYGMAFTPNDVGAMMPPEAAAPTSFKIKIGTGRPQ